MSMIMVNKRDGSKEPLDLTKFHKVISWACEGLKDVSVSDVAMKSTIQFYDGIQTSAIQETLIKAASDLISEEHSNYQYVAGRLVNYHIRKQIYGEFTPPKLYDQYKKVLAIGYYDKYLNDMYTESEWEAINKFIVHDRDNTLTFAAMETLREKYLVKNRVTKEIYETPQIAYMLIAMTIFAKYSTKTRLTWVKEFYDAISTFDISLPTPIMAGLRTPQRQFSSCVLIESDDSLDSIIATTGSIVKYVSQKAGIGLGAGKIRALGSKIREGDTSHTGVISFYKLFNAAVQSTSQGGVRKGSATLFYPVWHLEFEELLVLKNNKGIEDNRIRTMDYGVQFNRVMYERLINNGVITLFSPNEVPGLYDAFFSDTELFEQLYIQAEQNPNIRKKQIPAFELFTRFATERLETGRIYLSNVDNVNDHSPYYKDKAPIRMSNLCMEIGLNTTPLSSLEDENGRIALCTLAAINFGNIKTPADFKKPCELAVRALDEILDYQDYPVKAAKLHTQEFRPLGIGIINLANFMAQHNTTYSNPNLELLDEYFEAWSYYLIKASADLAKEKGTDLMSKEKIKYFDGIIPIDTRKQAVDTLIAHTERMDWKSLREQLKETGIRNSTLTAIMPAETSAIVSNSTNGIEPVRALITSKMSKDTISKQVVPNIKKLKNKYELLWNIHSPEGYLNICAVLQKYVDQAISVNTSYNPKYFEDDKISIKVLLKDILNFYKFGGKNLYYNNTNDGAGEIDVNNPQINTPGSNLPEEDCEGCKI